MLEQVKEFHTSLEVSVLLHHSEIHSLVTKCLSESIGRANHFVTKFYQVLSNGYLEFLHINSLFSKVIENNHLTHNIVCQL